MGQRVNPAFEIVALVVHASKLMELDTTLRDSRCARALRVNRLEDLRFSDSQDKHVLSPVSGDKCLVCYGMPPHPNMNVTPVTVAVPASLAMKADLPEAQAMPSKHLSSPDEPLTPEEDDFVPDDEIEPDVAAPPRKIRKIEEDEDDVGTVPSRGETFPGAVGPTEPVVYRTIGGRTMSNCKHFKTKFNSTCNSKRRVQTMLFWKSHLGISFPITDGMLRDHIWKNLESCGFGIKRSNGHAKHARGGVCINPFHYHPVDYSPFLTTLIEGLTTLGLHTNETIARLVSLRDIASDDRLLFDVLCNYIRCAPLNIVNPMVSMPTTPARALESSAHASPDSSDDVPAAPAMLQAVSALPLGAQPALSQAPMVYPPFAYISMPMAPASSQSYMRGAQMVPSLRPFSTVQMVPSLPPRGYVVNAS